MKKIYATLAIMLAFSTVGSISIFAEETQQKLPAIQQSQQKEVTMESQYMTISGKISSIEKEKDYYVISVTETEDEAGMIFTANENAFVINSENGAFMTFGELKNDMVITAIVAKNAPMTMSLPPMTNAMGFVAGEENFVTTGYFDEEWTSTDAVPMLQLNISEQTIIVDSKGSKKVFTQQDVQNTDCLVVYGATTRSIPAQTNPVFVMILDAPEVEEIEEDVTDIKEAEKLTEEPQTEQTPLAPKTEPSPEGNFVPLREIAENNGFTITWTANDKPVILQKGDTTIEITVGQKEYKKNGEVFQAQKEAKLMQSKIYVSENIIS